MAIQLAWSPITDPRDRAYAPGRLQADNSPVEARRDQLYANGSPLVLDKDLDVAPPDDTCDWHVWQERTGGVCPIVGRYLADKVS